MPSCITGPDHTCSDGYCYTADTPCDSMNLTLANEYACMCSMNCSGNTSSMQVSNFFFQIVFIYKIEQTTMPTFLLLSLQGDDHYMNIMALLQV